MEILPCIYNIDDVCFAILYIKVSNKWEEFIYQRMIDDKGKKNLYT